MFRIGDFSHIARVSTRLLRYYDKLGLLEPNFVHPDSGYRFYTADQLPRLNRILALKEMGLSLDEVETMIDSDVPADQLRGMLTLKASELAREIETQQARMRFIESRIDQIEALALTPTTLPAVHVLSTVRTGLPDLAHGLYAAAGRWIESNDVAIVGPIREVIMQRPGPGIEAVVEVQFPINPNPQK